MLNVWTQASGYSLGTYENLTDVSITLPTIVYPMVVYTVISGNLPLGLYIEYDAITDGIVRIVGKPQREISDKTYTFCIRATEIFDISDRTFSITITGIDSPILEITNEQLPIGNEFQYYTFDNSSVMYQLRAYDAISVGLTGFVFTLSGHLPPGLSLDANGLIYGTTAQMSDVAPYAINYQFYVTVSNGFHTTTTRYGIYVINPKYFTTDNTNLRIGNDLFTTDIEKTRPLQWVTEQNLGEFRANNFCIIPFQFTDNTDVVFSDDLANEYPPGMTFDAGTGVLSGQIPKQTFVTQSYSFVITATRGTTQTSRTFVITILGDISSEITWKNATETSAVLKPKLRNGRIENIFVINGGAGYVSPYVVVLPNKLISTTVVTMTTGSLTFVTNLTPEQSSIVSGNRVRILYTLIPTNYLEGVVTAFSGTLMTVDIDNVVGSGTYSAWTIVNTDIPELTTATARCEVKNGAITYIRMLNKGSGYTTPPVVMLSHGLATVTENKPSDVNVTAYSSLNKAITYTLIDGQLPPGLSLLQNGEISGIVKSSGFTSFSDGTTFIDIPLFDREFIFTVSATDGYGSSLRTFSMYAPHTTPESYSTIKVKPLLPAETRLKWNNFVNDITVFQSMYLYREFDSNFGIQKDLSMLVYPGIETTELSVYVDASRQNNAKKRFILGSITSATATDTSGNDVYEIIYISMKDQLEVGDIHLPNTITSNGEIYYPNSITEWQERLSNAVKPNGHTVLSNNSYLPLWMRTVNQHQTVKFVMGVPICYCKVGASSTILLNIKRYFQNNTDNFTLDSIDYLVDRFYIDSVIGYSEEVAVLFESNRTII